MDVLDSVSKLVQQMASADAVHEQLHVQTRQYSSDADGRVVVQFSTRKAAEHAFVDLLTQP